MIPLKTPSGPQVKHKTIPLATPVTLYFTNPPNFHLTFTKMPSNNEESSNAEAWRKHHASNPMWASDREKQTRKQLQKNAIAELKAGRQAKEGREIARASSGPSTTTSSVDININNTTRASSSNHHEGSIIALNKSSKLLTPPESPQVYGRRKNSGDDKKCSMIPTKSTSSTTGALMTTPAPPKGVARLIMRDQKSGLASAGTDTTASKKRKHEEDASEAQVLAKKPKVGNNNSTIVGHPSELVNGKAGCYQNAVLHLLSSIPAFVALGKEEPLEGAKAGIAPVFAKMMRQMLNNKDESVIQTKAFRRTCSEIFGMQYNGQTQEDADEFMMMLVEQLQKERPDLKLAAQFDVEFVKKANCDKCGAAKEIAESSLSLVIAVNASKAADFNKVLRKQLRDTSDFEYRSCEACNSKGAFNTDAATATQRMRSTPAFLKVAIPRHHPDGLDSKNRTKVDLPKHCVFLDEIGNALRYKLVGAMGHDGRKPTQGHWFSLRKVDGKWFQCDSAEFHGVESMRGPDFNQKGTQVSICLFKRL
jgi:ubiquitin C-terminal hydrolase